MRTTVAARRAADDGGLLLIPVTVNGQGPFLFVLDTGTTRTMLDRGLADRLQLQSEGHRPGQGTGGIIDAHLTTLRGVDVGEAHRDSLEAGILDWGALHQHVPDSVGSLGVDFLRKYTMTIDYARSAVTLTNEVQPDDDGESLAFEMAPPPFREAEIDGHGPFQFVIDTGADVNILDPGIAVKLNLPMYPAEDQWGAGGSGTMRAQRADLKSLAVGPYTRHGGSVTLIDVFGPLRASAGRDFVGILGYPFFGNRSVTFDFPNSRLCIRPGA